MNRGSQEALNGEAVNGCEEGEALSNGVEHEAGDDEVGDAVTSNGASKKKKNKKKKNPAGKTDLKQQTVPPTIPIVELFPDGVPERQLTDYKIPVDDSMAKDRYVITNNFKVFYAVNKTIGNLKTCFPDSLLRKLGQEIDCKMIFTKK